MHARSSAAVFCAVGLALALRTSGACSSGAGGGDGGGGGANEPPCFDYSEFDPNAATVTFHADVLPVFRNSCGLSDTCHGKTGLRGRPFLGPKKSAGEVTEADIDAILQAIVGVPADAEPGMSTVAPGDPERSFLMHKVDGTLTCEILECAKTNDCGEAMPDAGARLPRETRDLIRRWIAQGAKKN